MSALHGELVGCGNEGQASQLGDLSSRRLGKTGRRVDARSHRCAAQRQTVHSLKRGLDPLQIIRQHSRVAGPFLTQCQRGGVLHVGAADLDDALPGLRFRIDGIAQSCYRWDQALLHIDRSRDIHRRWK